MGLVQIVRGLGKMRLSEKKVDRHVNRSWIGKSLALARLTDDTGGPVVPPAFRLTWAGMVSWGVPAMCLGRKGGKKGRLRHGGGVG